MAEAQPLLSQLDLHLKAAPFLPKLKASESASTRAKSYQDRHTEASATAKSADQAHLEALAAAMAAGNRQLSETNQSLEKTTAAIAEATATRDAAQSWLEAHSADRALPESLPEFRDALASLTGAQKTAATAKANIPGLETQLTTAEKKLTEATDATNAAITASETAAASSQTAAASLAKAEAGRTLAARREELENIKLLRSKTIAQEEHAAHLAEAAASLKASQKKLPATESTTSTPRGRILPAPKSRSISSSGTLVMQSFTPASKSNVPPSPMATRARSAEPSSTRTAKANLPR